ncbi:hypothetical protein RKD31_001462 [Streptomyces sp. SAI-163]|uniref:hypothetical protein n=1 Tax=Streptomyces sp. SAI-163 TaxID=3377735 RepID=UPI003C7E38A6
MWAEGALRGSPASTTRVRSRERPRTSAADSPAAPPPTTTTSYVPVRSLFRVTSLFWVMVTTST